MLTFQLIVSTMNQVNYHKLAKKMNICSDAIIINQSNKTEYNEVILSGGGLLKCFSFNERGIGLSRNNGLIRSDADIIEFADDDMVFTDTYKEDIVNEYKEHPEADIILFSNKCLNENRMPHNVTKFKKINRIEAVNFGGARITARREKLLYNNIYFSLLFGGGAKYAAGEDTTFIQDCIKAGLKVYQSPVILSTMKQDKSSWFNGYNQKYFFDKGALLKANFPILSIIGVYYIAYKNRVKTDYSYLELLKMYKKGMQDFNSRR